MYRRELNDDQMIVSQAPEHDVWDKYPSYVIYTPDDKILCIVVGEGNSANLLKILNKEDNV